MEEKRPGEYFPVFEDEKGTYIMNSRDMCMIDHIGDLMRVGVDCIKIEGRAKSAYYAAIVTGAYRHVIDDVAAGRAPDPVWRDEVEHVSHRHYSTGFITVSRGSTPPIRAISATGRSARSSRTAPRTALRRLAAQ